MKADAKLADGETGLHWAAYKGNAATVKLLLEHTAPVEAVDETHDGTPLEWALYGWGNSTENQQSYYNVVALLVRAGAKTDPQWFENDEDRKRAAAKLQSDPRMLAALRGEVLP